MLTVVLDEFNQQINGFFRSFSIFKAGVCARTLACMRACVHACDKRAEVE